MVLNLCTDKKYSFKSHIISLNEEIVSKVDTFMRTSENEDVTLFFDNLINEINSIILLIQWRLDEKNETSIQLKHDLISLSCTSLIDLYCQKELKTGNLRATEVEHFVHTCFYFLAGKLDYILDVLLYSEKVMKLNKNVIQLYIKKIVSYVKSAEITEIDFLKMFVLYHWYLHIFGSDGCEAELRFFLIKTGLPPNLNAWFKSNGLQFESKNVQEMLKNYSFKDSSLWLDIFAKSKQDSAGKILATDEDNNTFQFFIDKGAGDNNVSLSFDQTDIQFNNDSVSVNLVDSNPKPVETVETSDETSTSAIFQPFLPDETNELQSGDDFQAPESVDEPLDLGNDMKDQENDEDVIKGDDPVSSPLKFPPSPHHDPIVRMSKLDMTLTENDSPKRRKQESLDEKIASPPKFDEKAETMQSVDSEQEKTDEVAIEREEKQDQFDFNVNFGDLTASKRVLRQRKSESVSYETPTVPKRKKSNSASIPAITPSRSARKRQSPVENAGSDKTDSPNDGQTPRYQTRSQTKRKL